MSTTLIKPIPNYIQNHFFKNFIELCNSGKYLLQFTHFISQDMIQNNKHIMINHTIFNKSFFTNIELIDIQLREFIYMVHKDLEVTESIQHIPYIQNQDEENFTLQLQFDISKIEIYNENKKVSVIPFNELKRLFSTSRNVQMVLQPVFHIHIKDNVHYFGMKLRINKIYY